MPSIDVVNVSLDGNYEAFVPTLRVKIQLADKNPTSSERIVGGYVSCDVSLKNGSTGRWLGKFTFPIPAAHGNPLVQREIIENFPLDIDTNSAMFDHVKTLEGDDITFLLTFKGFIMWQNTGNPHQNYPTNSAFGGEQMTKEATLSVEKWRKIISAHYRNLAWIAVSRETYSKINKLLNEKGITPDELFSEAVKQKMA